MFAITGATGNIGRTLIRLLAADDVPVRAISRKISAANLPPNVTAATGDLSDPETLTEALTGVDALFLLTPGTGAPDPIVDIAKQRGVRRIVLVSSMLADTHPDSTVGAMSLASERAVTTSDLDWTLLRPWEFASNALHWAAGIRERGVVRAPAAWRSPVIHPADIASVARAALTEPHHTGRAYSLTGPDQLSPAEQTRALGIAIGRRLAFEEIPPERVASELAGALPPELLAGMAGDGPAVRADVRDTVERVTGKPARTFQQWAYDNVGAFT